MPETAWMQTFPGAITVCDSDGIILAMNDRAAASHAADGGYDLIGTNLLDCHPEPSRSQVETMLAEGSGNVYTIEKGGVKKLVYQQPWYEDGQFAGLVEMVLPLPESLPHFLRE